MYTYGVLNDKHLSSKQIIWENKVSDEYTKTLRVYKGLEYDYEFVLEDLGDEKTDYVAISHPVEVTFEPLDKGDVVRAEIDHLESSIDEVKAKAAEAVQAINDKIQSLLALPNLTGE
jgi:hypothetical protein